MGCMGGGGFAIFSCFGGAFEADCVDASANFSHTRVEHLGALGAFCLGGIGEAKSAATSNFYRRIFCWDLRQALKHRVLDLFRNGVLGVFHHQDSRELLI